MEFGTSIHAGLNVGTYQHLWGESIISENDTILCMAFNGQIVYMPRNIMTYCGTDEVYIYIILKEKGCNVLCRYFTSDLWSKWSHSFWEILSKECSKLILNMSDCIFLFFTSPNMMYCILSFCRYMCSYFIHANIPIWKN